ncbi:MAG: Uma2 family endonuclease [Planctomycetes bacterium]|nr:Uma2 family endonuclease [Planctomycetota bacterium]MCG2683746.1 Uma2 family endonuclease [Planctomycetales bacterium]
MTTVAEITTAEQLFQHPGLGRCELLRGELVLMSPSGSLHAIIAATLAEILCGHVKKHNLGWVFGAEGGFQIRSDPDTVRAPDVAFVSAARMPASVPEGFFPGPPDLAVEVLSPNDRASEVLAKVSDWLEAGCRKVWVVDPETRSVAVYAPKTEMRILHHSDTLTDQDVLPGFKVEIRKIFPA